MRNRDLGLSFCVEYGIKTNFSKRCTEIDMFAVQKIIFKILTPPKKRKRDRETERETERQRER